MGFVSKIGAQGDDTERISATENDRVLNSIAARWGSNHRHQDSQSSARPAFASLFGGRV